MVNGIYVMLPGSWVSLKTRIFNLQLKDERETLVLDIIRQLIPQSCSVVLKTAAFGI